MKESSLTVELQNVVNLRNRNDQPINAYFVLSCEGQRHETEFSSNPQYFEINKRYDF